MALLVLILILALPFIELAVLIQVSGSIGVWNAVGLLIVVSLVGVWLAKREGLGVINRIRQAQADGEVPSRELADGALIMLAAILLVIPGFVTDVVGILLLLPPIRIAFRTLLLRQMKARAVVVVGTGRGPIDTDEIWDADSWEEPPRRGELDGGGSS